MDGWKIKGTKDVNAAAYDRVYDGKMDCTSLENIYQKFNVDHQALRDVVAYAKDGEKTERELFCEGMLRRWKS